WDGTRVAFAGVTERDSAWRVFVVPLAGGAAAPVTRTSPGLGWPARSGRRFDDLDPCWVGPSEICFASPPYPPRPEYPHGPPTNLAVTREAGPGVWTAPPRITTERNGAEEPVYDFAHDRVVFARWWFNRFKPSKDGITTSNLSALSLDSVNVWQAISIPAHG